MPAADSHLISCAASLRADAQRLRAAARHPQQTLAGSGWTGHRATQLGATLSLRAQEVETLAHECDRLAAQADHLADQVRQQMQRMHALEGSVAAWLSSLPAETAHAFTSTLGGLPQPGSPQWAAVARNARAAGARL